MSLSWIFWKPRMLEPSKPMPSEKTDSVSSLTGTLKCCQVPGRSVKRKSTIFAPRSLAFLMTSFGLGAVTAVGDIVDCTSVVTLAATDSSIAMRSPSRDGCRPRGDGGSQAWPDCRVSG
jgi:hypothetical protein